MDQQDVIFFYGPIALLIVCSHPGEWDKAKGWPSLSSFFKDDRALPSFFNSIQFNSIILSTKAWGVGGAAGDATVLHTMESGDKSFRDRATTVVDPSTPDYRLNID
ncbi:hypothetical protein PRIPAC_93717 [Pristionchus pacificus]|uniref:Uncharacterized protein n=1 Tax=Pristionchus pacificus TaxID=54126 RepID=A0A2A6BQP2_PRIPA|nr:hypothetical protein PRIPAC_93717 [Pristionchus pacificus]|eukprot:PDM68197.1 hypothetical protein PRIPAC_46241 [Pristionchus pacificus]